MLASSAVISGLVSCPDDIREVKISSYDYIRGNFFISIWFSYGVMESLKGLEVVIWGSIIRCKVYAIVSCKVNFFPNYFTI